MKHTRQNLVAEASAILYHTIAAGRGRPGCSSRLRCVSWILEPSSYVIPLQNDATFLRWIDQSALPFCFQVMNELPCHGFYPASLDSFSILTHPQTRSIAYPTLPKGSRSRSVTVVLHNAIGCTRYHGSPSTEFIAR